MDMDMRWEAMALKNEIHSNSVEIETDEMDNKL